MEFTFNKSVILFREKIKLACQPNYIFPHDIWAKYLANESTGRGHYVEQFDALRGLYRVITARRPDGRGENVQIINFQEWTCTCCKWKELRFPCSHVFAACSNSGTNPSSLVFDVYANHTY